MFEKYLKIIKDSKDRKDKIITFLNDLGFSSFALDIIGQEVVLRVSSLDLFLFEENKVKINDFLKTLDLKLK